MPLCAIMTEAKSLSFSTKNPGERKSYEFPYEIFSTKSIRIWILYMYLNEFDYSAIETIGFFQSFDDKSKWLPNVDQVDFIFHIASRSTGRP